MRVSFMTDTGLTRSQNQDAVYASCDAIGSMSNLFLVADGMGGHNAGEYASNEAIALIKDVVAKSNEKSVVSVLSQGITTANEKIYATAAADVNKSGMGTTLVAASIQDETLFVANVGDSRLYILKDDELVQVTRDHSVIEEMVRNGEVSREVAQKHPKRNLITRAVGAEEKVCIDFFDVDITEVDAVLMCTDGLTTMLEEERIYQILSSDMSVEDKVARLVAEANQCGGRDNITVVVIESLIDEVEAC